MSEISYIAKMKKYYLVESKIPLHLEDEINVRSHEEFMCTGVEEFSINEARVDEILGDRSYSGGDLPDSVLNEVEGVVKASGALKKYYFANEQDCNNFKSILEQDYKIDSEVISQEIMDWDQEWKKSYAPIIVGSELEIIPSWDKESYQSKCEKSVFIYPGRGFGTGSHETTFLCLKLYLDVASDLGSNQSCLDFGCGSGILGIVAKLFNRNCSVDLYDIDAEALENCVQNIELNNCKENEFKLLLPKNRKEIDKKYQVVFANILQNVLLEETNFLCHSLVKGGHLFLSGLLLGQEQEVINAYISSNKDLQHVKTITKGDWVAIHMEMK